MTREEKIKSWPTEKFVSWFEIMDFCSCLPYKRAEHKIFGGKHDSLYESCF